LKKVSKYFLNSHEFFKTLYSLFSKNIGYDRGNTNQVYDLAGPSILATATVPDGSKP